MATETDATLVALHRFGLGARPGDPARIAGDPRGFVREQIAHRDAAVLDDPSLEPGEAAFRTTRLAELERERERRAKVMSGGDMAAPAMANADMASPAPAKAKPAEPSV